MCDSRAYTVGPAVSDDDLRAILALQSVNHRDSVAEGDRATHGFLSLRHTLDLLREMNKPWAHTVARRGDEVVGYALTTLSRFRDRLPALDDMFERLRRIELDGRPASDHRYFVMGQVCVAREHRGQGLVDAMYRDQAARLSSAFDWSFTEVDAANPRSLRAHKRSGWTEIDRYTAADRRTWVVIGLRLRAAAALPVT